MDLIQLEWIVHANPQLEPAMPTFGAAPTSLIQQINLELFVFTFTQYIT